MYLRILLCALLVCFSLFTSFTVFAASKVRYGSDVALLKTAIETAHPGYSRYLSEAEQASLWKELDTVVASNPSELTFYSAVSKLLVGLRCQHTKAEFSPALEQQKKQAFMPFRFRIFDNRMFVQYAHGGSGLLYGDEIVTINGITIQQIISKLSPYVERDGYTDHTVTALLEENFDLLGSNFEQFFSSVVLQQNSFATQFEVGVRRVEKHSEKTQHKALQPVSNITLQAITFDEWIGLSGRPYRLNFGDAVSLEIKSANAGSPVAILTVDTFVNYRKPVDALALFDSIFSELEAKGVRQLIVDLRNNGGGSDDAQMALLRHLYQVPFTLVDGAWLSDKPLGSLAGKLNSWDRTAIDIDKSQLPQTPYGRAIPLNALGANAKPQQPAKYGFKGNIVLLTSKSNASASAALLAHIQQQPNVTLVGEATGGNQGGTTATITSFLTLPTSKIVVRIPLIRNRYNIENSVDGLGATPDIYAIQRVDDFLAKRDVAMLQAMALFAQH
jgi:hypothetical protein